MKLHEWHLQFKGKMHLFNKIPNQYGNHQYNSLFITVVQFTKIIFLRVLYQLETLEVLLQFKSIDLTSSIQLKLRNMKKKSNWYLHLVIRINSSLSQNKASDHLL